jgi:transposase
MIINSLVPLPITQTYYTMLRADDPQFSQRHNLVACALKEGIHAATRLYECSRNTVRKWLRRYQTQRNQGLLAHSRAPHSCPHKTSPAMETKALALRKKSPGFGARRLIAEFGLKVGHNALNRIFRQHQLTRPPKRRHHRKNDLRAVKAAYAPFTRFQMDVKHLSDIPFYWPQMQANGLPRFQYTIRELSCGAQFLAYSNELSKTYAALAVDRFLRHLQQHGLDTSAVILTTDLGTEFDGTTHEYLPGGFHLTLELKHHATHRFNPPACPNANADVESVHHNIEAEFFDAQVFASTQDFFSKISTYQLWYNAARKNSSRNYKSPADLLALKAPLISPKVFLLHPIPLEHLLLLQGGHDVPGHAAERKKVTRRFKPLFI